MEPNDNFDDFDTQIQSDELIPDGYEDRDDELEDGDWEPDSADPEFVKWAPRGADRDGYDGEDDFPF
jgi:hypothetical protein